MQRYRISPSQQSHADDASISPCFDLERMVISGAIRSQRIISEGTSLVAQPRYSAATLLLNSTCDSNVFPNRASKDFQLIEGSKYHQSKSLTPTRSPFHPPPTPSQSHPPPLPPSPQNHPSPPTPLNNPLTSSPSAPPTPPHRLQLSPSNHLPITFPSATPPLPSPSPFTPSARKR